MPREPSSNDAEFDERVSRLMRNSRKLRRLGSQIRRQQERLRKELSLRGWLLYLRLDELVIERQAELIARLRREL
jgi:hypothetical protein